MMTKTLLTTTVDGREVSIETGIVAKQADGAIIARSGSNMVLVTVVSSRRPSDMDFFPLTVEYLEKFYAAGKIPGGYIKRETRPGNHAILNCRLIDRPLRPTFPDGYNQDTQVVVTTLSTDGTFPLEILATLGASAAFHISDIPFNGPVASCLVGRKDGKLIANPSPKEFDELDLEMIVSGTKNGLLMVEGEADFLSEEEILEALKFGHDNILPFLKLQDDLREKLGREKREFAPFTVDADFRSQVEDFLSPKIKEALAIRVKLDRYAAADAAKAEAEEKFLSDISDKDELELRKKELGIIVGDLKYSISRNTLLDTGVRIDGRATTDIRPIFCEAGMLPRTHGSSLFTRGETQVLGVVTLGTGDDEQTTDTLLGVTKQKFMLHYNFPPYSVGETGRVGFTSRREVGHGYLAERALKKVTPSFEDFPYTIRVVGEVMESNGSSSMGTVCSGSMAMLDAGIPTKGNVSGIAMGLIKEGDRIAILSDILGDEDHLGDMDFKVAGTKEGITSLQMDIKIDSLTFEVMEQALNQAKSGRAHILAEMEKTISEPRGSISEYAPRIETLKVKPEKVREVIGAGGKVIKGIIEETGVKINIEDDGTIHIASADPEASDKAIKMIKDIVTEPEVGTEYEGTVVSIKDFGAFVEILPNNQGLLHISEIAHERVRKVEDFLKEGDKVKVKVLDIDRAGRIKLSRKALLDNEA